MPQTFFKFNIYSDLLYNNIYVFDKNKFVFFWVIH